MHIDFIDSILIEKKNEKKLKFAQDMLNLKDVDYAYDFICIFYKSKTNTWMNKYLDFCPVHFLSFV